MTTNELVSEGLKAREEERSRGGKVRDGQGQMGDGHREKAGTRWTSQANVLSK